MATVCCFSMAAETAFHFDDPIIIAVVFLRSRAALSSDLAAP